MGVIPEEHRPAVRAALDELVAGGRPDLMVWLRRYGDSGAELAPQPDAVWEHRLTEVVERGDGTLAFNLPLWTAQESPSDLSAEGEIDADGAVRLTDVHVL